MKYIVDGNNNYQVGLVQDILSRRGIEDTEGYLNLTEDVLEPLDHYDNMQEGMDLLLKHIENENKIHILIDTDLDGATSAGTMYQYIQDVARSLNKKPDVTYHINKGKNHGISMKDKKINPKNIDLLIVPDAGTSDREAVKWLTVRGTEVLIIDHHNPEWINVIGTEAVLINPQTSPRVQNKNIAGAGVVYKFCSYIDRARNTNYADRYLDLVAIGNVADMIDLREFETKYIVEKGLSNIQNDFVKELAETNAFMMNGKMNPTTVGWNIAPSLNATIRVGKPKERMDMFEAIIGVERDTHYKTKKFDEMQSLQKTMARVCGNIKGRQDRAVKKSLKIIQKTIVDKGLAENQILVVDVTGVLDKVYTGLVANKLASQYMRPILLLQRRDIDGKETFGGSGRNYERHAIDDLQEYLLGTGFFDLVAGHDNAFGVEIEPSKVQPFLDMTNEDLKDVKIQKFYTVDYEIPMYELKSGMIKEIASVKDIWGKGVGEPLFAITDIRINSKDVELHGTRGKTIRFKKNDITFQQRYANEKKFDAFTLKQKEGINVSKDLNYTIIGKLDVYEYKGRQYLQVDIVAYTVEKEDLVVF